MLPLHLSADAAGAEEAPTAHGFEHAEEADQDQGNGGPEGNVGKDDSNDKQNGSSDAARDAALETDVSLKKSGHAAT
jgi:hypothetical protein